jgi:hypothetical protein
VNSSGRSMEVSRDSEIGDGVVFRVGREPSANSLRRVEMTKGTLAMVIATQLEARPKFKIPLAHTCEVGLFGPEYLALDRQTISPAALGAAETLSRSARSSELTALQPAATVVCLTRGTFVRAVAVGLQLSRVRLL